MSDSLFGFLSGIFEKTEQHQETLSQKADLINYLHNMDIDFDNLSDAEMKSALAEAVGLDSAENLLHNSNLSDGMLGYTGDELDMPQFDDKHFDLSSYNDDNSYEGTGNDANENDFCGYTKKYCQEEAEYYEHEAKDAYENYESAIKDGNDSKAASWLSSYESKKETAQSWRDKVKWASDT